MHWKLKYGYVVYQPIEEREGVSVGTVRWDDVEGYIFMPAMYELTALDLTHIAHILNTETAKRKA